MTLRDWFAGQALAGYCARTNAEHLSAETLANQTYIIADAMIAERTK